MRSCHPRMLQISTEKAQKKCNLDAIKKLIGHTCVELLKSLFDELDHLLISKLNKLSVESVSCTKPELFCTQFSKKSQIWCNRSLNNTTVPEAAYDITASVPKSIPTAKEATNTIKF
ncbi:hypothetical protein BpHYR1_014407 [Brachionus plicatilis]|uniref:Uncharacterized protein n=1 Tax=Brachionus plicatilis TaxID=10195 RepID=A0A3M7QCR2_BRAPC|nr:hypothetical protein BpHYR1_014407 [Brachionus plicatilis]